MKRIIILFVAIFSSVCFSQNKKLVFGFDKIPQTLLLNPGAETTYRYHIGMPLLSGLSVNTNSTNVSVADLFNNDKLGVFKGTDFNQKIAKAIDKLENDDYLAYNAQIDVFNFGWKLNARDYFSAGYYLEADVYSTLPKDLFILLNEGNANHVEKVFPISQLSTKADLLGVWHLGLSRRVNSRITVGGRFKIYSGSLNVNSSDNRGAFSTHLLADNYYEHIISGLDANIQSSGMYDENNNSNLSYSDLLTKSLFSSNLGVGIDLGFTYHIDQQSEITGSLIDLGFVSYNDNLRNYRIKGNHTFTGFDVKLSNNFDDYWNQSVQNFNEDIERGENKESYIVMRPLKGYASYAYSFGKSKTRANCHDNTYKDFFDNTIGGVLYSAFQAKSMNLAYTLFFQRKISKVLNTKITYTVDDFSGFNIGLGASLNVWKLNLYGVVDNIFSVTNIAEANTFSAQVGLNFIVN